MGNLTLINVIGVLLIIMGIFLVISVLMQSSKNHRVSGSIAGGAETFFGKKKGKTLDAVFNKLTTVVTIIFVVLVLALCFVLPTFEEAREQMMAEQLEQFEQQGAEQGGEENTPVEGESEELSGVDGEENASVENTPDENATDDLQQEPVEVSPTEE